MSEIKSPGWISSWLFFFFHPSFVSSLSKQQDEQDNASKCKYSFSSLSEFNLFIIYFIFIWVKFYRILYFTICREWHHSYNFCYVTMYFFLFIIIYIPSHSSVSKQQFCISNWPTSTCKLYTENLGSPYAGVEPRPCYWTLGHRSAMSLTTHIKWL